MDVNKVEYNGENGTETLIDLTADTVTPETLVKGATAHDRSGANITGAADYAIPSTSTTSPLTDSADALVQRLTIYGRSEVVDGAIKSVGDDGLTVTTCGKNLFGGLDFAKKLNTVSNESIIDTNNKTVSFDHYASIESNTLWVNNTKSNQFTIITTGKVPTEGYVNNSLNIEYDDGTTASLVYINTLVKTTKLFVTDANKTVKRISLGLGRGNPATLYYDECGVFEGVKTESDFEPYNSTIATFTTALPLRSTLDGATRDELIIGNGKAEVITRCEVVDDSIVPLATPVITPLTPAEISAFRGLRTYDSTTNITITDEPDFELDYLKNSDNGQAVADIQKELQGQIDEVKNAAVMGSTIVVVTDESTLYGRPVTVTAGTKIFTGTFSNTGECTFSNLAIYGAVQAESTNSEGVSAKGSTNITYFGTYVVGINFNVAAINLTCSDVSFAGVPVSIYHNGEVVTETSLRLNGQGVLEGIAYVENTGRYTAVATVADKTVFASVAVITLKQTYTGTLAPSYLPNSDIEHIICEAYGDNFVDGALTWGNGQTPVAFNLNGGSVTPTLQEDNSVYIPVATNNIFASVDLGAPATPFTAYVVMKLRNPGTDSRMIGAMNSRSGGQGILLYSSTIQISSWANETSTGISSAQYVVCAIQFVGTNLGRGFVRGYGYAEKPSATAGQYVTLARPDIKPSTGNASPGDGYFKYIAVINEAESIQTVQANIEHLNSVFLGE